MKIFRALFLAGLLGASVGYSADVVINPTTDAATIELGTLSDVADLSGAASGEVFEYNGTKWTNATASAGGSSTNVMCIARALSNDNYPHSGTRTLQFDTIVFDSGGNFNTGTYTYTVPVRGFYTAYWTARNSYEENDRRIYNTIVGGTTISQQLWHSVNYNDIYSTIQGQGAGYCEVGDTIYVTVYPYTTDVDLKQVSFLIITKHGD